MCEPSRNSRPGEARSTASSESMKPNSFGPLPPKILAKLSHKGEHARADHDVIDGLRAFRDLREIFREGRLGRRDGDRGVDGGAEPFRQLREGVAMLVAEHIVRHEHGDLLAGIGDDPGRHCLDLAAHVREPGLEGVAVEGARREIGGFRSTMNSGSFNSPARGTVAPTTWLNSGPKAKSTLCWLANFSTTSSHAWDPSHRPRR